MKGWITYYLHDEEFLKNTIGVALGERLAPTMDGMATRDCEMTMEVFNKLEPLWGQFIWGLE